MSENVAFTTMNLKQHLLKTAKTSDAILNILLSQSLCNNVTFCKPYRNVNLLSILLEQVTKNIFQMQKFPYLSPK